MTKEALLSYNYERLLSALMTKCAVPNVFMAGNFFFPFAHRLGWLR